MRPTTLPLCLAATVLVTACSNITDGFGLGGGREVSTRLAPWDCRTAGPIDANSDQIVQAAEWGLYARHAYSAWDSDGDGRITRAEFDQCWQERGFAPASAPSAADTAWTAFNADGDEYLNSHEFWGQAAWARIDANRNGVADTGEWSW